MSEKIGLDAAYEGREHSRVKHLLLEAYLTRLLMIVGQKFDKIAYVDGFAGPWRSNTNDYSDSSFGIALRVLDQCQKKLNSGLNPRLKTRALFIEQDANAAAKIRQHSPNSVVWEGDFGKLVADIPRWLSRDEFAFVFVDPFGWKDVVTPAALGPLLQRRNTELLINVMWDHIKLATGHDVQRSNLTELFGANPLDDLPEDSHARRQTLMTRYRKQLAARGNGPRLAPLRTMMIPIEYVDKDSVKFFLVYATHSPLGIITFGEESEHIQKKQQTLKFLHRLQKLERRTGMSDLFGATSAPEFSSAFGFADALEVWRAELKIAGGEMVVDESTFAQLSEENDLLPSELQDGVGQLIAKGEAEIPTAKRPRPKNPINWRAKEHLVRKQ
jgi:three-Cys-motif partner protein